MKKFGFGLGSLVLVLVISACAGVQSSGRSTPEWVLQRPAATASTEFFVVSGFSNSGNETEATEAASGALITEINQYLGVNIDLISQSEGRGTLEQYEENLRVSVTTTGSGNVTGLRIQDRYIVKGANGVTVYVLAAYDKRALEEERAKRAALITEQEDAVAVPEAQAQRALASGNALGAITGFSQAASAALGSDIRNAEVKFERNIKALTEVVQGLRLDLVENPGELAINQRPTRPFLFRVSLNGRPSAGIDLRVSFSEAVAGGRTRIQNITVKTGGDGVAEVILPAPTLVGDQVLNVAIDLDGYVRLFDDVSARYRPLANALFDASTSKLTRTQYRVVSLANRIPLALYVVDVDASGAPTGQANTAQGIAQSLTGASYTVTTLALDPVATGASGTGSLNTKTVISLADARMPEGSRLVVGKASITSVTERDGFLVRVSGSIEVYDIDTGNLLFSQSGIKTAQSATSARAMAAAFQQLGQDFAAAIIRSVP